MHNSQTFHLLCAVICALVVISFSSQAQTYVSTWHSLDGPWFASYACDIAVGSLANVKVMYVADSSANSLLKTTDEGTTWQHLIIDKPAAVA